MAKEINFLKLNSWFIELNPSEYFLYFIIYMCMAHVCVRVGWMFYVP